MWVPPTSADELPPAFDKSQFNFLKTWTEYINRLIGVVIGLLILAIFVASFRYIKSDKTVFAGAFAAFVLLLFQGWLGGQVVGSELDEWLITIHMLTELLIVMILLFVSAKASSNLTEADLAKGVYNKLLWTNGILLLSTHVREPVDILAKSSEVGRDVWLTQNGTIDEVHRSFSWLFALAGAANIWVAKRYKLPRQVTLLIYSVTIIIAAQIEIGYGIILTHFGIPLLFQILHLTFAALLICVEFLTLLVLYFSNVYQDQQLPVVI